MNLNLSLQLGNKLSTTPILQPDILYDLLIIGAGPAGLNAALYAKRKGLNAAIVSKKKGGQVIDTSSVDNYLGVEDITGEDLVNKFHLHLSKLDIPIIENAEVVDIFSEDSIHHLILSTGESYKSKTLIIATGSKPRQLDVPGELRYAGKGVAYCPICDAPLFKDKKVIISGGGNSAVEAALDLAKLAESVTLIHRSQLRADKVLVDHLNNNPKITVYLRTKIIEIIGNEAMTGVLAESADTLERYTLKGDGIFVQIGHIPNTDSFKNILLLNKQGEIITNEKKETNIPGIFAAGDVTSSTYKQIVTAVSDGAIAALAANDYINQTIIN